jgi:hypothetical protein
MELITGNMIRSMPCLERAQTRMDDNVVQFYIHFVLHTNGVFLYPCVPVTLDFYSEGRILSKQTCTGSHNLRPDDCTWLQVFQQTGRT